MQADPESHSTEGSSTTTSTMEAPSSAGDAPFRDEERGLLTPTTTRPFAGAAEDATEIQVQQHPTSDAASDGFLKRKTSQLLEAVSFTSSHGPGDAPLSPRLATLVDAYAASAVAAAMKSEIEDVAQARGGEDAGGEMRDVVVESGLLRGRKRASWTTQFGILSGRAFKNLYRDPALLTAHYTASIALARVWIFFCWFLGADCWLLIPFGETVICGLFYQNVSNDIGGFQNRLGTFALRFSVKLPVMLTMPVGCRRVLLHVGSVWFLVFVQRWPVCKREDPLHAGAVSLVLPLSLRVNLTWRARRSNGYYSSFTYFSSKVSLHFRLRADELTYRCSLHQGPVRHLTIAHRAAHAVWWDRVRPRRLRADRCRVLEVPAHARAVQPHDRKRGTAHRRRMREHERRKLRGNVGDAVQVRSFTPSPICWGLTAHLTCSSR